MSSAMNLVTLGILPLAAVVFLVWMAVRNLQNNLSAASRWSLVAVAGLGLMLMPLARFGGSVMIHLARRAGTSTLVTKSGDPWLTVSAR
jgi:hypothetical protein